MTGPTDARVGSGQTLVEFALVVPVFLVMLFGLIDIGRYVYLASTVSQAAREAARTGSVQAYWVQRTDPGCNTVGGPVCPASVPALRANMLAAANRMMAPFGGVGALYVSCDATNPPTGNWTATSCASRRPNDLMSVRVTADFSPLTPIIAQLVGPLTQSGSATMAIN